MPIHDWKRIDSGTFHHFHTAWITHLSEGLNEGLLPSGFYALAEQYTGRMIADVLTLHIGDPDRSSSNVRSPVAVADAPPRVSRKIVAGPNAKYRALRRTLTIREAGKHRVVALIEIVSPANKDRASSVTEFVEKVHSALRNGIHVLVVDLFPAGPHDARGLHGAIWESFDSEEYDPPPGKPLILSSYSAGVFAEAYLEAAAVGDELPEMPLFLEPAGYVNIPLQSSYDAAYRGLPAYWKGVLEGKPTVSE